MTREETVLSLLADIAEDLKQADIWQTKAPSTQALESTEPFCIDTLEFTEWVQWVMLPRFEALIVRGHPLPTECSIYPMAEEALKGGSSKLLPLLQYIQALDDAITLRH